VIVIVICCAGVMDREAFDIYGNVIMSDWNGRRMRISRGSVKKRRTSLLSMDDAENSQVIKMSSFEKGTCSKTNGRSK
jgi:hypothetical protein